MLSRIHALVFLVASGLLPAAVRATVADASEHGFTVVHTASLAVDRAEAWRAAIDDVGHWWSGDHTVSGDAANLYITPEPLGCFCERLGDAGGLVHLQVTFVNPGVLLRMTGGLGPLGLMGVNGNLTLEFDDDPDDPARSQVTLRYAVGGYRPGGLAELAGPVDAVLGEQIARLQAHVAALP